MLAGFLAVPWMAGAQNSSLNTFSPYTFYGLGDLENGGTPATRAMGGIGVAYWNPYAVNLTNPAAYSAIGRQRFIFEFGLSGKSSYLKSDVAKSAYNGFNVNDVAVQFPLYKGIGFAVSVMPVSSVGYRAEYQETNEDIIADVGHVMYKYNGDGGVTQFKGGVRIRVFKGFSLGADFIYYLGTITRYAGVVITPVLGSSDSPGNVTLRKREEISKPLFDVGMQWDVLRTDERVLTLGAVFQPQVKLNNKTIREVTVSTSTDSISTRTERTPLTLPDLYKAGIYYRTERFGAGFDYSYQDWKDAFSIPQEDRVSLDAAQSFRVGLHYTPNRFDIRRALNRWTYRLGFRYEDQYLVMNGRKLHDMAVTFGVGIPVRATSMSEVSVGVELGRRGKTSYGLIRENYFRVSVGFSLFGEDYWFVKQKYD